MKVKLFTHTDLDGVGCTVVGRKVFNVIDVEYCDYDKIDEKVSKFIDNNEYLFYDLILITDISVNEEVATKIDSTMAQGALSGEVAHKKAEFALIDHHATASWLNKYTWATVMPVTEEGLVTAGTSLLLTYLIENNYYVADTESNFISLSNFVESVRRWDTWHWFNVFHDELPKQLNNLLYIVGRERFAERFTLDSSLEFTSGERLVLDLEDEKIKKYITRASYGLTRTKFDTYENVGVIFAENYISELGNTICVDNPDLDFVAIINIGGNSISFRGIRNDIDLGTVASKFGGGGHAKAAGAKLDKATKSQIIDLIFKGE